MKHLITYRLFILQCILISVYGCVSNPIASTNQRMLRTGDLVAEAKAQINEVSVDELNDALNAVSADNMLLIDVREPYELRAGKIEQAVNIPRGRLEFDIWDAPQLAHYDLRLTEQQQQAAKTPIYLYCRSGARAALAAKTLQDIGFENVYSLTGGYKNWVATTAAD